MPREFFGRTRARQALSKIENLVASLADSCPVPVRANHNAGFYAGKLVTPGDGMLSRFKKSSDLSELLPRERRAMANDRAQQKR